MISIMLRTVFGTVMILLLMTICATGQVSTTDTDNAAFVIIYMEAKEQKPSTEARMQKLLQQHQVSAHRYQELSYRALADSSTALSVNETNLLVAIDDLKLWYEDTLEAVTLDLCTKHQLDYHKYLLLQERFKTDLTYQRELHPYFQTYINSRI